MRVLIRLGRRKMHWLYVISVQLDDYCDPPDYPDRFFIICDGGQVENCALRGELSFDGIVVEGLAEEVLVPCSN